MLARSCSALSTVSKRVVPPFDQQTQQRVEPADRAGPVGGDLVIAIGEQPEHDAVLIEAADDIQRRCAPTHDRGGAGVVRVGLVDRATLEQPNP